MQRFNFKANSDGAAALIGALHFHPVEHWDIQILDPQPIGGGRCRLVEYRLRHFDGRCALLRVERSSRQTIAGCNFPENLMVILSIDGESMAQFRMGPITATDRALSALYEKVDRSVMMRIAVSTRLRKLFGPQAVVNAPA